MDMSLSQLVEEQYIEQYIYNPNWEIIVPSEHEFGIKNDIETDENETFPVIRDPSQVQDLVFKLAGSSKNEIQGIFSTSNAFHRQEVWAWFLYCSN
jgi:hypothetical protein